jgi:hypothetical protein
MSYALPEQPGDGSSLRTADGPLQPSAADMYPGSLNFPGSPQSPSFDQTFDETRQGATRICSCAMPRGGIDGEFAQVEV